MGDYRLYFLDELGRVVTFMGIDCQDDDAAIEVASGVGHRYGMELWDGPRMVRAFDAPPRM